MRRLLGLLCLAAVVAAPLAGCGGTSTPVYAPTNPTSTPRASAIYVASASVPGSIVSVDASSNGGVTPLTAITGSNTQLAYNAYATIDSSGRVWTTNCQQLLGGSGPVVAFPAGSTGNITPSASIAGSSTGLSNCQTGIATDPSSFIYVADVASTGQFPGGQVAVFAPAVSGNVVPARVIAGLATGLHSPAGLAIDRLGYLYVVDSSIGFPSLIPDVQVFAPNVAGNISATRVISGSNTGLSLPQGIVVDNGGAIYVANAGNASVTVYSASASGNASPMRTIQGTSTQLDRPAGLALDANGYLYVGSTDTAAGTRVLVFAPAASGNTSPVQAFSISGYSAPAGIAVR